MNGEQHFTVVRQPLEAYRRYEPTRLEPSRIQDHQFYHLMMRAQGQGAEAALAPVFIEKVQYYLGHLTFDVLFTNRDLQPVTKGLQSSLNPQNYWIPIRQLPLSSDRTHAVTRHGFIMPYNDVVHDAFPELSAANDLHLVR